MCQIELTHCANKDELIALTKTIDGASIKHIGHKIFAIIPDRPINKDRRRALIGFTHKRHCRNSLKNDKEIRQYCAVILK